jgi:tetratricopeptide (TPR) repeat protein
MLLRRFALALSFLFLFTRQAEASDADAANPAARQRYQRAAQAYSEGRFKDAIDIFLDAARMAPNPAFSYNIALAYEQLGDAPNALRWFREYLRAKPDAPDRAEIEPRMAVAEKHLRDIGIQQLTVVSSPEGATLTVDDRRTGVTPWTGELAPGHHRIALELRDYGDSERAVELPGDHAIDVRVALTKEEDEARVTGPRAVGAASLAPSPVRVDDKAWFERVRPLTWATLGVGTASLVVGAVFEVSRRSAQDDAVSARTNVQAHEIYESAKNRESSALIATGIGGALVAVGGVLLYFDVSRDSRERPRTTAGLGCTGALCGLDVKGTF